MMSALPFRKIACLAVFFVLLAATPGWTTGFVTITGINVSPEGKIIIETDGRIGKHNSFILQSPSRLVMDLEGARIGHVPARLKIDRGPIREVRLGQNDTRTRFVVDFGDHPTPPFKVHRYEKTTVVALELGSPGVGGMISARPQSAPSRGQARSHVSASVKPDRRTDSGSAQGVRAPTRSTVLSDLVVKETGADGDIIFVELADRRNPSQTYRLVVDMDKAFSKVQNVTLSDSQGNLRRLEAEGRSGGQTNDAVAQAQPVQGPRRGAEQTTADSGAKPRFRWGMDAVQREKREAGFVAAGSPFSKTQ